MKKKKWFIIGGIAAIVLLAGVLWFFLGRGGSSSGEEVVYVSPVSVVTGQGSLGIQQRFSGIVEPQQTYEVEAQQDRAIKEVHVEKGQEVSVGTPLFTYDTDQTQSELDQANLDLERMKNDITNLNEQIATLEKEKRSASQDEKLNYTTQIQMAQNDIKKTEYNIKSKEMEIAKLQDNLENATISSDVAGVIKSINKNGSSQEYYYGQESSNAFITILEVGAYRVKGTVNEQNIYSVMEGQPVIIRSRVDDNIWYGVMGAVDTENGQTGGDNMYYYSSGDEQQQSTKYPFYVTLDYDDGLMLGQHVYIEMDFGQEDEQTGLWLPEYFICDIDTEPYVWADNGHGKLEKKKLTLGEYNPDMMEYEILDGLTAEDAITFPEESLANGMATVVSMDGMMGLMMPAGDDTGEDMMSDDMIMDDMVVEEQIVGSLEKKGGEPA